jgi:phosphoglycerate dehydrogenase-like enzyme
MNSPSNSLLVFTEQASCYLEALKHFQLPNLGLYAAEDLAEARKYCGECTIILGDPHWIRELLTEMPRLRWVQSNYVGVAPLLDPASRRDYLLTNVGALYSSAVSEYVFCYLLMHERRAWQRYKAQTQYRWDNTYVGTLRGKVIGILGVGNNGSKIAETAKQFGMRTKGLDIRNTGCLSIDRYYYPDQLLEFLQNTDYLVCILPDTPQTHHLINQPALETLPQRAVLINVGRGSVIDDQALTRMLQDGKIAGAVLDVLIDEPLPTSHPFWSTPNLILTFHTAAPGPGFNPDIVDLFVDNYQRFVNGQPLRYVVDWERGY